MISVKGLTKSFDGKVALDELDMTVPTGSIYGLVGTNGAGKTTIIKHLAGVLRQNEGEIMFDDEYVWENEHLKQRIGVIPDELYFPASYNLKSMRALFRGIYDRWDDERFHEMTSLFGLDEKRRIKGFSKGMKKQVMFALVMSTQPDYLLLDEPIDGLDPIVRKLVWKYIVDDVASREMTVLVSSHNLKDMEDICDHIGIIDDGHMVLERELDSLKSSLHKIQVSFGNVGAIGASIKDTPAHGIGSDTKVFDVMKDDEAGEGEDPDMGAAKFDPYKGLNILHRESRGTVDLMIIDNDIEEARKILNKSDPILLDILPLSLEELFIYELGGENDAIRKLVF